MADNLSPNKIDDKQERRAEHIADRLEKQGMGEDHAKKEAIRQAVAEEPGSMRGGGNAANEPKKDSSHVGDHRNGSRGQQ